MNERGSLSKFDPCDKFRHPRKRVDRYGGKEFIMLIQSKDSGCEIVSIEDKGRYIAAMRKDDLPVFFDKSTDPISAWLNHVRETGDRKSVMLAVGMARGLQIAQNYADKYGNEEEKLLIAEQIESLVSNRLLSVG